MPYDTSFPHSPFGEDASKMLLPHLSIDLNHAGASPSSICRDLIKEGVTSSTEIKFYRGKTLCFVSPTTVGAWAAIRAVESENGQHMRFVKTS